MSEYRLLLCFMDQSRESLAQAALFASQYPSRAMYFFAEWANARGPTGPMDDLALLRHISLLSRPRDSAHVVFVGDGWRKKFYPEFVERLKNLKIDTPHFEWLTTSLDAKTAVEAAPAWVSSVRSTLGGPFLDCLMDLAELDAKRDAALRAHLKAVYATVTQDKGIKCDKDAEFVGYIEPGRGVDEQRWAATYLKYFQQVKCNLLK